MYIEIIYATCKTLDLFIGDFLVPVGLSFDDVLVVVLVKVVVVILVIPGERFHSWANT